MQLIRVILSLLLLQLGKSLTEQSLCTNDVVSECRCIRSDGGILDLKPSASRNASAPRYVARNEDVEPTEVIQFNPCYGFRCGKDAGPADSAVCDTNEEGQVSKDGEGRGEQK